MHPVRHTLLMCCLLLSPLTFAGTVLENKLWRIELEPATLALRVTPAGEAAVQASSGVAAHAVNALRADAKQAAWQWDNGAYRLTARLEQRELSLTIQAREAGELALLRQPASAMGQGLIWPLAEGHYVPVGNAVWKDFLLEQGALDTTQDLSLPLWGVDHGRFTLNWLLTNPYNNRLAWRADGQGLALSASHEFTSLEPHAPMTLRLYLGEADPLAGAKRYQSVADRAGPLRATGGQAAANPRGGKIARRQSRLSLGQRLAGAGGCA